MVLMMGIGETLREAREAKGYTLEDIQETTKIQKRYLIAIEQNDFQSLPGKFYARAFIKEYAQVLDLDVNELLQGLDEEKIQTKRDETIQYTRMERSKRTSSKSSFVFSVLPSLIVVLLIVGIIFVAITLYQRTLDNDPGQGNDTENDEIIRNIDGQDQNTPGEPDDEGDSEEDDGVEEQEEPVPPQSEFTVVDIGEGNSPLSTVQFTNPGDEILIQIEVTERTYLDVRNSSEQITYQQTLTPDMDVEPIDVSGEEKVYLNVGYTPGLNIMINDVPLEYPTDKEHQKIWVEFVTE